MDRIDEIIDQAIGLTDTVAANTPEYTLPAMNLLRRLRLRLLVSLPNHPALKRIDEFLTNLEQRQKASRLH